MFKSSITIKAVKTSSPKKGNIADLATRMYIAIEFKAKNLEQDTKNWNVQLLVLTEQFEKVETIIKPNAIMHSQTLSKDYHEITTQLSRLNKAIETSQKKFNKALVEYETKLLIPFKKGDYNTQLKADLEQAEEKITKIQELITSYQQPMQQIIEKSSSLTKRVAAVENIVSKLCLPVQLDDAIKVNESLNQRLQVINQASSALQADPNPKVSETEKVGEKFVMLYRTHLTNAELLDKIAKDLKVPEVSQLQTASLKKL